MRRMGSALGAVIAMIGSCLFIVLAGLAFGFGTQVVLFLLDKALLGRLFPGGLILLLIVIPGIVYLIDENRKAAEFSRRVAGEGWTVLDPAAEEWPWTGLRRHGTIKVSKAWAFEAGGFPVIAGFISWTGSALEGVTRDGDGSGDFVVLRLPAAVPGMAMRWPYRVVGEVPPVQASELRVAFLAERVPTWTVTGHHLFTIEAGRNAGKASRIDECVRRALLVAELLELTPEGSGLRGGEEGLRGGEER